MTERADELHHDKAPAHSTALVQAFFFFWQSITSPTSISPPTAQIWLLETTGFFQTKIAIEREEICEWDGHIVHKHSERCLTADWLAPRESDYLRIHSKVSSDWLPSFIEATRPVLEIFNMPGYCPDSPRIVSTFGKVDGLKCFTVVSFTYTIGKRLYAFLTRRIWREHIMLT